MSKMQIPAFYETQAGDFIGLQSALLMKPETAKELLTSEAWKALLSVVAKLTVEQPSLH